MSQSAGLTIVVLTRNRRERLRGCLESLQAQADAGGPLEFVLVDDGSTDGTAEMAREWSASQPRWRYIRQSAGGIAAARNAGIRASRTPWIAIVADDYRLPADYAASIAAFFRENPRAQVIRFKMEAAGGGFLGRALQAYHDAGVIRRLAGSKARKSRRASWLRIPSEERTTTDHGLEAAGAAAFRREVFDRVGLFDESFARGEDTEFTGRLRAAGIAVTYEPRVRIGHRPDPRLRTALKNNFVGGRAARRLAAAREGRTAGFPETMRLGLRLGPQALYWSCWRAWRIGGPAGFLSLLPVLILLETAYRTGYLCAGAGRAKIPPAAAAGPLPR